jgi:hypothetical protein
MPGYIPYQTSLIDADGTTRNYYVSPWIGPQAINTSTDSSVGSGNIATWNFFANEASKARKTTDDNGYAANFALEYDVPFIKGLSVKGTYAVSYANDNSVDVGDYYTVARATNTNEAGQHLLGDYTTWNFLNFGDPNGTD